MSPNHSRPPVDPPPATAAGVVRSTTEQVDEAQAVAQYIAAAQAHVAPANVQYFWDGKWRNEPRPSSRRFTYDEPTPNGRRKGKRKSRQQHSDYCNTDIDSYGAENEGRIRNTKLRPVFAVDPRTGMAGRGTWESYEPDALYKQQAPAFPADTEIVWPRGGFWINGRGASHSEMVARAAVGVAA